MHLTYLEANRAMISGLLQAASEQEAGRLSEIEQFFDTLDERLPRDAGPEFDQLFIALNFWDGWIDARNHDWKYYEGIRAEDWPQLAKRIVEDLKADREITDEVVRKHFDFKNQVDEPGILKRLTGSLL
jgi:hypothetical protein